MIRTSFYLLMAVTTNSLCYSQSQSTESTDVREVLQCEIRNESVFPGGDEAFLKYIISNLNYPRRCQKKGIEAKVLVKFVVDEKGSLDSIALVKPCAACPEFDKEAIRVLQKCPPWIPAVQDGKYVRAWRTLPIRFSSK